MQRKQKIIKTCVITHHS